VILVENNKFDIIIVGAGPGGSTAAIRAREYELSVLLIDKKKFPRDKVCGDALSGSSVNILRKLNLIDRLKELPHQIGDSVVFGAPNGEEIFIKFKHYDPTKVSYGYVVRRWDFDNFMKEVAREKGAVLLEEMNFTELLTDEITGSATGIMAKGKDGQMHQFNASIVIGADGFGSKVASQIGSIEKSPEHFLAATRSYYKGVSGLSSAIELHFLKELKYGYFWIFPMANGFANVGLGIRKDDLNANENTLIELQEKVVNSERFRHRFKDAELDGKIKGWTLPIGSTWRKLISDGVMLIGDAAGLIDPFTGEGIGNAMTSGYLASEIGYNAITAQRYDIAYLADYETKIKQNLGNELALSTRLQKLSSYKFLLNFVIGKAAKNEEVRDYISGMIANEHSKTELKNFWFYLKLLFK